VAGFARLSRRSRPPDNRDLALLRRHSLYHAGIDLRAATLPDVLEKLVATLVLEGAAGAGSFDWVDAAQRAVSA
jgi:hypothetical protein